MPFDFANAQPPALAPLAASFTENPVEDDLKWLFIDLFIEHLADDTFDANVLGAAHLGSFELVRRAINSDGLVLIQGDREAPATRYLYRAWNARNNEGRGLHFLRTYLQMLYPGQWDVEQLVQEKNTPYPTALSPATGSKTDWEHVYLTSRIRIYLDYGARAHAISRLANIIQKTIPARLVPEFKYLIKAKPTNAYIGACTAAADTIDLYPWQPGALEFSIGVHAAVAHASYETITLSPLETP